MADINHAAGVIRGIAFPELNGEEINENINVMTNVSCTIVIDDLKYKEQTHSFESKAHLEISGIGETGNETTALDDITIEWRPMS